MSIERNPTQPDKAGPCSPPDSPNVTVPKKGIRARRKAETRRLLSQSALVLFASKGYEGATAAEIAASANVTERSFFLHFATKADALFDTGPEDLDDFHQRIIAMPEGLSDYAVLCRAIVDYFESLGELHALHQRAKLLMQSVASSPVLRGKQFDENRMLIDVAATALAQRGRVRLPSTEHQIVALLVMSLFHESYLAWARQSATGALRRIVESYFSGAKACLEG